MYEVLSQDYDRFVNWKNRLAFEIPFIEKQIAALEGSKTQPLDILDTACGTGMHAIALAQRGHRVSGADLYDEMVQVSRRNAENADVNVRFSTAAFGELASVFGENAFDMVFCLGNSLPHLLSAEALITALRDFAACLRPGGMVLIQNRNFDAVMQQRDRWMEPQVHREGSVEWIFQRFYDFLPEGLIHFNIVTLKNNGAGGWVSSVVSTSLRPQLQAELAAELLHAGFERIRNYGSMNGEEFSPDNSGNLILTGLKKKP